MKRPILLAICLLTVMMAQAVRTNKQMLSIAKERLNSMDSNARSIVSTGKTEEIRQLDEAECYCIYGSRQGFVIISKDEQQPPVLAYSETAYDARQLPCGLRWWLDMMDEALKQADALQVAGTEGIAVEPLLTTSWGQGAPFNLKCPTLNGKQTPSGCVATAMAQVLNFFKYPESGKGTSSYTVQGGFRPWSVTYGASYRYDLLKDKYDDTTLAALTSEEQEAISLLLLHCGAAVKMNYNADGSGANHFDAADGMATYLRYDSLALHCYMRDHFTNEEWMKMLTNELTARHPIFYTGVDTRYGGHAFVIDGINAEGMVHVNWGWDGDCNGYYTLDGLTPKRTMGFAYGYNYGSGQSMITGYKLHEQADGDDAYHSFWATENIYSLKISGSNFVISNIGGLYNYNWLPFEGTIALVFEDSKGNGTQYGIIFDEEHFANYKGIRLWGYGFDSTDPIPFILINSQVPAGEYKVYLGSKDIRENSFQPLRCGNNGGAIYYTVTKTADGLFSLDSSMHQYDTAVETIVSMPHQNSRIFDLQGRRVPSPRKGIYIIGGKKVVSL